MTNPRLLAQALEQNRKIRRYAVLTVGIALVCVGLAYMGSRIRIGVEQGKAQEAESRAVAADSRSAIFKDEAAAADGRARLAAAQRDAIAEEVKRLRAQLAKLPKPEPPTPAPVADADLSAGLKEKGILTPLPRIEAMQVWSWSEDAIRVPALERRDEALEALVATYEKQIQADETQIAATTEARDKWKSAFEAKSDQATALQDKVSAMVKEQRAKEFKWWVRIVGTAATAYFVGRAAR